MNAVGGRRAAALTLVLALALMLWAPTAGAESLSLQIPIDTVVRAPEGSEHPLASVSVPAELQGLECTVSAVAHNQTSVHPGNDLVVASGGDVLVLEDVEGIAGGDTTAEGTLILSDIVTVTLQMGTDAVFSAGFVVEATCSPPTTTTTTSSTSSTSSSTTATTAPSSTTTTPSTSTSSSTTVPGSSTTTTVPAATTSTTTTSTTVPGETTSTTVLGTSTSTTTPDSTSSTVLGTSTSTIPEDTTSTTVLGASTSTISPSTVPFTGLAGASSVPLAAGAIAVGTLLVALTGQARERSGEGQRRRR